MHGIICVHDFNTYLDIDNTKDYNIAIINYLSNNFIPSLKEINSVKDIINKLIMDSIKIKDVCNLLNDLYMNIYSYAKYKKYTDKYFELVLDNINI